MSDFIDCKDLKAHWGKRDFELFGFLKKGLQPYTQYGQEIVDTDTLEHYKPYPIEYFENEIRRWLYPGSTSRGIIIRPDHPWTEEEIKQGAQKRFERQPQKPLNLPPHHMSFTLPDDAAEASKVLSKLNSLLFEKDQASEFAEQHGLRLLDDHGVDQPFNDISISRDANMTWNDITVTVLSDVELHFQWKTENVTRRYNLLGFEDKRTGNPIKAWTILLKAAETGQIPWAFKTRKQVEKIAQTLRKNFKALFPMVQGDPVPINSASEVYEFSFKLKPQIE